ncbi:M23 family metallopeptidase [bacterium 1XD42-8]|nr:M23 family metallopeptidase [bacterium 1XD42-8]
MQKKWWVFGSFFLFVLLFFLFEIGKKEKVITVDRAVEQDYIKWVDFKVTCEAMKEAYEYDVQSWNEEVHLPWIELLAYLGAKYGGDFSHYKQKDMEEIAQKLREGEVTIQELKKEMKYFSYYLEAYGAVLGGMVGEYEIEREEEGEKKWEKIYGLKAFSPIPKGFPYSDYDDFGVSRSYGYKRTHLGHDVMGQIGTPIVAVESGYVEALGWNQYGGWRIGIRSFDKKRYYYYAHLRQNYPYAENLKEGDIVIGGDIIGYMGHTGYSKKENVNNIDQVHLHWGLQLIFHESQKEGSNEIWISCYELMKFLRQNQVEAKKVEGTKEWKRTFEMKDLNVAHP